MQQLAVEIWYLKFSKKMSGLVGGYAMCGAEKPNKCSKKTKN